MNTQQNNTATSVKPKHILKTSEAVTMIVGLVIGAGIFKTPSLVASITGDASLMFLLWIAGGVISFLGALCYAELGATYPHAGGDYHYLELAYGRHVAFLFGWARIAVITTGSIALLGFVFGDYMNQIVSIDIAGLPGNFIYAFVVIVVLSLLNLRNIRTGITTQKIFTSLQVLCLLALVGNTIYLLCIGYTPTIVATPTAPPSIQSLGLAMVFVLLTFGGWNEAAYISAEMKGSSRAIVKALLFAITIITALYLLVTWSYWQALGITGMAQSMTIAADVMTIAMGPVAQKLISAMIAISALTSINATIFVGARTSYAMGQSWPALAWLGKWHATRDTPANAIIVQAIAALVLVILGAATGGGFVSMVEFTAPVFWLFFLLCVLSIFVLRKKFPNAKRPFSVPLYPVIPLLFCISCAYMLYSSLSYVYNQSFGGINAAWIGVFVLLIGIVVLCIINRLKLHPNLKQ